MEGNLSTDHPIVNLRIVKSQGFAIGIVTTFTLGFAPCMVPCSSSRCFARTCSVLPPSKRASCYFRGDLPRFREYTLIGMMLKRGVPAQFMAAAGFGLFFVFTWMLSNSTLESGTSDFFLPLIIRGIGMALLFVPLTTLALQDLKGPDIGQGTGLNNMMRQLGGSFGIAIITTMLHIKSGVVRNKLIEYINPCNPVYNQQHDAQVRAFTNRGYSLLDAQRMAMQAMEGKVIKQTMLLTYDNLYLLA